MNSPVLAVNSSKPPVHVTRGFELGWCVLSGIEFCCVNLLMCRVFYRLRVYIKRHMKPFGLTQLELKSRRTPQTLLRRDGTGPSWVCPNERTELPRRKNHGRRSWRMEMLMHELSDVWQMLKYEFLRINKCWASTLISSTWKIPECCVIARAVFNKVCRKTWWNNA